MQFQQPDTVIPEPYNPQSWNRYSYTLNNPIRYNDPSGHISCDDTDQDGNCINYELRNKRLRNNLKRFKAPAWDNMTWLGTSLADGEAELMFDNAPYWNGGYYGEQINFGRLLKMRSLMVNADNTTISLYTPFKSYGADFQQDPSDAFHHAYWNALMTRDMGADFTKLFTDAHETRVDSQRNQTFMDLHNNQVGIQIALDHPTATDAELADFVLDSITNGELVIWDGSNIYYSDQCPDCWWRP
jgi:hypothetical protein